LTREDAHSSLRAFGNAAPKRASSMALAILILIAIFLPLGLLRFIDGDEGYYLLAGRLVSEGKAPYEAFFFPQMPLTAYVYGLWFRIFGASWYSGRILSALFGIAIGLLLYLAVLSSRRSPRLALLAAVLYASSSLAFGWFTVAKTYALSTFLLVGAYLVTTHLKHLKPQLRMLLGGLLFGLAVNTRLYLCATIPAFVPCLLEASGTRSAFRRNLLWFLFGALVALLPDLYFVLKTPGGFLFGNIGYHLLRSDLGLAAALAQKVAVVFSLLGIFTADGVASFQFNILLLLGLLYLTQCLTRHRRIDPALYIGGALCLINLAPTPTFVQYGCVAIPFLVLVAIAHVDDSRQLGDLANAAGSRQASRIVLGVLLTAYAAVAPIDLYRYAVYGRDVPGIIDKADRVNWRIETVRRVSRELDRLNPEKRDVVSWWPGYFLESSSRISPGLENHFGLQVAEILPPRRREELHVRTQAEIVDQLRDEGNVVVLGNWASDRPQLQGRLRDLGYRPEFIVGTAEIQLKQSPD
jgi:4-amino-4-deoxy-L-arabinose transferase-like glycosyltransferase